MGLGRISVVVKAEDQMRRQQRGYIYSDHGAWFLRWYNAEGNRQTKRLASVSEYPRKCEVRPIADETMVQANASVRNGVLSPGISLADFLDRNYLPDAKKCLEYSTYAGYEDLARLVKASDFARMRVRDFTVRTAQDFLYEFAESRDLCVTTVKHIKAFLSGVFGAAARLDLRSDNPFRETKIPSGLRPAKETEPYSLEETDATLRCISDLEVRAQIATAAFAGLRRSEIAGLRWEDYGDSELRIRRKRILSHVGPTKSKASRAPVPVIPRLASILDEWKLFCGNPAEGEMFLHRDLREVSRKKIRPLILGKAPWRGWKAWRSGLASRLFDAGVADITIQQILRHANVSTTRGHYIMRTSSQARKAMNLLDSIETATEGSEKKSSSLQ
jgi:integrase